ncbi:MAG: O-antigen ligase family protein [Clostridiaceae bacterium]
MLLDLVLIVVLFLAPCTLLGEELVASLYALVGIFYLIIKKEESKVNKNFLLLIILINIVAAFSNFFTISITESLKGYLVYLNALIYFIIFSKNKSNKKNIYRYITYVLSFLSLYSIIIQGLVYHSRIYGNIGYANTFALILLCGLYINELAKDKLYNFNQFIYILAILYTGSRMTIFLLIIFIFLKIIINYKNSEKLDSLIIFSLGIVNYVILERFGIGMIFVTVPIVYFCYSKKIFTIKYKYKRVLVILMIILSVVPLFLFKTNTFQRIKNISIYNGSFQERLVYFEDSINHIRKNPLGSGIDTFEYREYNDQSAFYDVKYIHNSVVQFSYDIGILGGVIFLIIIIYGAVKLYKSKEKNRIYLFVMFLSMFFHSLLDFDFSYSIIIILITMIVAFNLECNYNIKFKNKKYKYGRNFILVFIAYLFLLNSLDFIGSELLKNNKYIISRKVYSLYDGLTYNDFMSKNLIATTYKKEYDITLKTEPLSDCLKYLNESYELNEDYPVIQWDLSYVNSKLGNIEQAIYYYEKLLVSEKFNDDVYKTYNSYLNELYKTEKKEIYLNKIDNLEKLYLKNKNKLSKRSKYLNNQLDEF